MKKLHINLNDILICIIFIEYGITSYSCHPGAVLTDIFYKAIKFPQDLPLYLMNKYYLNEKRNFTKTIIQGAQSPIHCAIHENIEPESGSYYS